MHTDASHEPLAFYGFVVVVVSLDSKLPEDRSQPQAGEDGQWVGAENWIPESCV